MVLLSARLRARQRQLLLAVTSSLVLTPGLPAQQLAPPVAAGVGPTGVEAQGRPQRVAQETVLNPSDLLERGWPSFQRPNSAIVPTFAAPSQLFSGSQAFAAGIQNPYGLSDVGSSSSPSFADLDGDGLLDAFVGEYGGIINFFENTGTSTAPAFAGRGFNPYGLTDVAYAATPSFADLDGDGLLDAFVGEYGGIINFFENTGESTAPAFAKASENPYGLSDVGSRSSPSWADLDGDGDLDAFIGEFDGNTRFFENTGTSDAPAFDTPSTNPFGLADVGYYSNPSFADLDGDGLFDAFVGNGFGDITFFKNTGTSTAPAFAEASLNPYGLTDVGRDSSPTFVDLDGDGDLDAAIGEESGDITFFENVTPPPVELTLWLWLEGPYAGSAMSTGLSAELPETDPYFGTATVAEDFFTSDAVGQQVVDWIWIELRTGDPTAPPMTTVAPTAALLLDDGSVRASDGSSVPCFSVAPGSYYVVVGHRNHLAVMSASALDCSSGSCRVDFRASAATAYGSNAQADLGSAYGLVAGDGNGTVRYRTTTRTTFGPARWGSRGIRRRILI